MNELSLERKTLVIKVLCEGNSIRSTARTAGTAINTVIRLLREVGAACLDYQDQAMLNLSCKKLQCDGIWSFVNAEAKSLSQEHNGQFGYGAVWTFTATDADTKLVPAWFVGLRTADHAYAFASDLKNRLANRVQLTTDGHAMYMEAIEPASGEDIDYGMLVKLYGTEPEEGSRRYCSARRLSATEHRMQGKPDYSAISASCVERQSLTMRTRMRWSTRLTNAFSRKLENHGYALALYFMHYNFASPHKSLANPCPTTPAMAAGITNRVWTTEDIVRLTDV